jgi:hypothetical protein
MTDCANSPAIIIISFVCTCQLLAGVLEQIHVQNGLLEWTDCYHMGLAMSPGQTAPAENVFVQNISFLLAEVLFM